MIQEVTDPVSLIGHDPGGYWPCVSHRSWSMALLDWHLCHPGSSSSALNKTTNYFLFFYFPVLIFFLHPKSLSVFITYFVKYFFSPILRPVSPMGFYQKGTIKKSSNMKRKMGRDQPEYIFLFLTEKVITKTILYNLYAVQQSSSTRFSDLTGYIN